MRKLIFAINTTLDGCCDHTSQSVDEEKLEYFTRLTREVDLQVFGRKTYTTSFSYSLLGFSRANSTNFVRSGSSVRLLS